jgi:RNA polymerase-interacting CarD/CdnL/TRCF family regulator
MPASKLPQVLNKLRSEPRCLPDDFKERQEQIGLELQTGRAMQLARVVRDLSWHRDRAHLTKRDRDLLRQGQEMLAAEMALVSGDDVSETNELIAATVASALAAALV